MINVAVDVGFGRVKALSETEKRISFPSLIGKFKPVNFSSSLGKGDPLSKIVLQYEFEKFFVGESALKQSIPNATVEKNRTVSKEGIILLMAAIGNLCEHSPEEINLVVGLPVLHYSDLKFKYQSATIGTHDLGFLNFDGTLNRELFVNVRNVKVLPQPFGTLFSSILDGKGELTNPEMAAGKIGVIDIGFNTLDLARAENLEFISPKSTSFSGLGMFSAYQALSNELYSKLGIEIPPEQIEPYIRQNEIKVSGKSVSISQYKYDAFRTAAANIISRVKSAWPDYPLLDWVIISGGGAAVMGEFLKKDLGETAIIVDDPMWANAEGFMRFGNRTWKNEAVSL